MQDVEILALSKKYTDASLEGVGALKGEPCVVGDVEHDDTDKVTNITLEWTGTGGTEESRVVPIPDGAKGETGDKGDKGDKGDTGEGVPAGGTTGQILKKKSGTNYDTEWGDPVFWRAGGSGGLVYIRSYGGNPASWTGWFKFTGTAV